MCKKERRTFSFPESPVESSWEPAVLLLDCVQEGADHLRHGVLPSCRGHDLRLVGEEQSKALHAVQGAVPVRAGRVREGHVHDELHLAQLYGVSGIRRAAKLTRIAYSLDVLWSGHNEDKDMEKREREQLDKAIRFINKRPPSLSLGEFPHCCTTMVLWSKKRCSVTFFSSTH